jgi:hypothetical protein
MLQIGRQGQLYVVREVSYGVHPTHAAADAVRHLNFLPTFDPKNKADSAEKKTSPGRAVRFDRKESATLNTLEALIRPSGTLNTVPEADEIFEAVFGAKTNVTLSTTVSSGGTTTGATVASAGTLAINDFVEITRGGVRYLRRLTAVAGAVLTWTPALPTAVQNGEAVKGCLTYKLTTALAISLAISHYLKKTDQTAGFKRGLLGAGMDRFTAMFDANEEARFTVSGPAKTQTTGATPAQPGAFTTVGGNPPSGLTAELVIGSTTAKFLKAQAEITNGLKVRNDESGQTSATELYRAGRRDLVLGLDMRAEDEALIYDTAETGGVVPVHLQQGAAEGAMFAFQWPNVEFKVPDTDDPDEEVNWPFKGKPLESADGANDECFFAIG